MTLRKLFVFGGLVIFGATVVAVSLFGIFWNTPTQHADATGGAALIAHTGAGSTNFGTVISPALNTTGATMIAVCYGASTAGQVPVPISDSLGNVWTLANTNHEDGDVVNSMWYSIGPKTGTSDTFTALGYGPVLEVLAFSGVASGPDKGNSSQGWGNGAPFTAGNMTPTNANELVVACATTFGASSNTIDPPLSMIGTYQYGTGGNAVYINGAYQVQTGASTVNPTWEIGTNGIATVADTFYSNASPAPFSITSNSLNEGFKGTPYAMQLTANGGIGPFTWSLVSGTLPAGLSLNSAGLISGTPTQAVSLTQLVFQVTDSNNSSVASPSLPLTVAGAPLTITTTVCPAGTQLKAYAGCNIAVTGGTPPYSYSWCGETPAWSGANCGYQALVEGLSLNGSTGAITGSNIMGQGGYATQFVVTDGVGNQAKQVVTFAISGNNTFGGSQLFPADSAYHIRVDSLPIDTSPVAQIATPYQPSTLKQLFGSDTGGDGGIPINTVPYNQPNVAVSAQIGGFTSGPIPCDAAMEGSRNTVNSVPVDYDGDNHVLVVQTAGGGKPASLYELYEVYPNPNCSWGDGLGGSTAGYAAIAFSPPPDSTPSLNSYTGVAQDTGTTDAAGLPVAPLLLNYDEVAGGCAVGNECGAVQHPIRFTLNHTINYHVWPATAQAGNGQNSCKGGYEDNNYLLSQSNPPTQCGGVSSPGGNYNPMGEIYRLSASVPTPAACLTNKVDQIIVTGLRDYGLILADNGGSGYFIGTPDARWPASNVLSNCFNALTLGEFVPVKVDQLAVNWPDSIQTTSSSTGGGTPPPPSDTTPPTTSITSPTNGATVSGTLNVAATASDNVAVTTVGFYVDGVLKTSDASSPYSFSLDTTSLSNGTHALVAKASDAAGNIGTSGSISITVSNTVVVVSTTTVPSGYTFCAVEGGTCSFSGLMSVAYGAGSSFTFLNLTGGTLCANSVFTDPDVGINKSCYTKSISDTTPPTASITSPVNDATLSGTTNISATAADNVAVTSVGFYIDGTLKGTDNTSPYSFSVDTTGLSNGTHTFLIKAFDAAGNIGTSGSVTVTVNNVVVTPPPPPPPPPSSGGSGSTGSTGSTSSGGGGGGGGSVTTAPSFEITSVSISSITTSSANINIGTHAPASVQLKYGATTAYGSDTSVSSPLTTIYEKLTGLTPGTIYDFVILATPASGGTTITSQNYVFTTLKGSGTTAGNTGTSGSGTTASGSGAGSGTGTTVTTPPPAFPQNISFGDTGPEVLLLEQILKAQGFFPANVAPSDYFGSITQHALLLFQSAHKLNKSGFVDVQSQALLNKIAAASEVSSTPTVTTTTTTPVVTGTAPTTGTTSSDSITRNLSTGSTGADVTVLQHLLTQDGDYTAGIFTTYYGPLTQKAVQVFQAKYGIVNYGTPATTGYGSVGAHTRAKLNTL